MYLSCHWNRLAEEGPSRLPNPQTVVNNHGSLRFVDTNIICHNSSMMHDDTLEFCTKGVGNPIERLSDETPPLGSEAGESFGGSQTRLCDTQRREGVVRHSGDLHGRTHAQHRELCTAHTSNPAAMRTVCLCIHRWNCSACAWCGSVLQGCINRLSASEPYEETIVGYVLTTHPLNTFEVALL